MSNSALSASLGARPAFTGRPKPVRVGGRRSPAPNRAPARRGGAVKPVMVLPDGIIIQGFHWESSTPDCRDPSQWPDGEVSSTWYATVSDKAEDMREAGFTDIWLPPPSQSVAKEGYLPTKLYDLDSAYGSYKELRALLRTLQSQGIGAILDCVINHRCGDRQNEKGKWVLYSDEISHDNKRLDWGPWALISNHPDPDLCGTGAASEFDSYHAAPNVDHTNREVRETLISWLNYMTRPRNLGFSSLRFDFVRGYDPKYVKEYVDSTVWPRGELSVGEWWNDDDGKNPAYTTTEMLVKFVDGVEGHAGAWDFALKTAMHQAALQNDWSLLGSKEEGLPGLVGVRPHLAFTYIDNHDTAPPQAHYPFPDSIPKLLAAHCYMLSHPGIPCVFWQHVYGKKNAAGLTNGKEPDVTLSEEDGRIDLRGVWVPPNNPGFSWEKEWPGQEPWSVGSQDAAQGPMYTGICGGEIKKMTLARSQAGVHSSSNVDIIESRKDLYQAVVTGRTVYGSSRSGESRVDSVYQLMVCIGPDAKNVEAKSDWTMVTMGSLHALYALKTPVELEAGEAAMDESHPHTYVTSQKAKEPLPDMMTASFFE
mmetsp:Transcript_20535/g.53721  ORF Transcript_20535/g.53721 Transcript_20535/m.53721 type:complete len:592 (+) Transcript_20535:187-1962(+)|eukprot:jgi/Tetstr1/449252/TSEL_036457.t1